MTVTTPARHAPTAIHLIKIVAVVLMAFTVTMVIFYYIGFFDEFQTPSTQQNGNELTTTPSTLTPARNLAGTWKTTFNVRFYIRTDFETIGELKDVGSEDRSMTWIITATGNENVIDVEVQFTSSNTQLVTGSGYTPDVSPMFLTGTISSSRLTLADGDRIIGEFSFTTDILTGTWNDQWSMAYEQQVYTSTNGLVLMKQ